MSGAGRARVGREPAASFPVARLMVDVPLAHLDHPFDYLVPVQLAEQVVAGSRVRVRFAGRLVDAFVLERVEATEHVGRLAYLERCVGEPVLSEQTTALFRAVADRWAGNFVDVVRLGVPSRHAGAEAQPPGEAATRPVEPGEQAWSAYRAGPAFLSAVAQGKPARAVWSALPGEDWPQRLAEAIATAAAAGRGVIAVVPDVRDLGRVERAVGSLLDPATFVSLAADLGPAERYRRWLAVRRGTVTTVLGTRAAAYAPVANLGLLAIWDDGDDLYDEPRAPYAHTRDVLVLRASQAGTALLLGGFARSAEAQQLVSTGWAHEVRADREVLRDRGVRARAVGDDVELARDPAAAAARLPSLAWRTARDALAAGAPVLVQVPRRGYVPSLACVRDRTPARCSVCGGPLGAAGPRATARCGWCGRPAEDWRCPQCGGRALRAVVVGAARTAEELGRAFAGVPLRTSGGPRVLAEVSGEAALVVATPGAEPVADGGYGAVLLLDGWALLGRADLRATEETLRRWLNAAALARPGGRVVVAADAAVPAVQAVVRWDPAGAAARELAERGELGFPPVVRMAAVSGSSAAVADLLAAAPLPPSANLIGPIALDENTERTLVRVPRTDGAALAQALKIAAAARSARKSVDSVRVALDPAELG